MSNRRVAYLFALLVITFVARPSVIAFEKPPFPDFKNNVDYLSWFRDQLKCVDEENAREEYSLFFKNPNDPMPRLLKPYKSLREQIDRIISEPRPWDANKFEDLNEYLSDIQPFLDAYIAGTQKKHFCIDIPEDVNNMIDIPLPHLEKSRVLTRAMIARAWKKDHFFSESFASNIGLALGHAYHINEGATLAEYLVANYEKDILYESILAALNQNLLNPSLIEDVKVFLDCCDSDNICNKLATTLFSEQAICFDLLQDMTKRKLLSITFKPRFDRKKVDFWLNLFGYYDGSFDCSERPKFPNDILSEDPGIIAQKIEGYYTGCRNLIPNEFDPNYNTAFQKLNSKYFGNSIFFDVFPMFKINYTKYYEMAIQLERKRRIVHLAVRLLDHYHTNKKFPDNLSLLPGTDNKLILTDPVINIPFEYHLDEHGVRIICPEVGVFSNITAQITA